MPPRPRPSRDRPWAGDVMDSECVSSVLPVRLYVHQNRPGLEMRNLRRDRFPGCSGRGRSRGGSGMFGGSWVPAPRR